MTFNGWLQIAIYCVLIFLFVKPFGAYMAKVFDGQRTLFSVVLRPIERGIYAVCGVNEREEQHWTAYAISVLLFSIAGFVVLYALQRLQSVLPFNPAGQSAVEQSSSFNTAVSFVTNTNWQGYGGESTMSYLTQMAGLTTQNFVSAAAGIAIAIALVRGFARRSAQTIGNFWVDLTRCVLYVLLPLAIVVALVLIICGVPQTLGAYTEATTLEGAKQVIAQGPVASQIAIKQLGTNGGGFFNANSAHPLENPTAFSNLLEMWAILAISAALTYTFGRMVGSQRQGWAIFAVMGILFLVGMTTCYWAESQGNPSLRAIPCRSDAECLAGRRQHGRQGGALRHHQFDDLGDGDDRCIERLGQLDARQLHADRRHGAAGQYRGRRDHLRRCRLRSLRHPAVRRGRDVHCRTDGRPHAGVPRQEAGGQGSEDGDPCHPHRAAVDPQLDCAGSRAAGRTCRPANAGPHGFSEILYAFTSGTGNNGSAFAGLTANTPFYNTTIGLAMLIGRFMIIVPVLAVAGSLVRKKIVTGLGRNLPDRQCGCSSASSAA